jgi:hypothetical protein
MPIIITTHMANMKAKWAAVHGNEVGRHHARHVEAGAEPEGVTQRENRESEQRTGDDQRSRRSANSRGYAPIS